MKLPSHSPDLGTWQNLASKLDAMDAEAAYNEKLEQLPTHSPDSGTWYSISSRLNRIAFYKTAFRIAASVAAGLLLFFTVSHFADFSQPKVQVSQLAEQNPIVLKKNTLNTGKVTMQQARDKQINQNPNASSTSNSISPDITGIQPPQIAEAELLDEFILMDFPANSLATETSEDLLDPVRQSTLVNGNLLLPEDVVEAGSNTSLSILQLEKKKPETQPTVKYYTPEDPKPTGSKNKFALATNYLPENIYNGTDNSLFHNIDLTASYNKEKVRYNTSIGMAYNEEQLKFDMNYDIITPVTSVGPGGAVDTLSYNVASFDTQYQGSEKHEYFTYNLGIGRRLFSIGKFSSWINAGAGFGIKLNNPDLVSTTEKNIKGQYNALITSVKAPKPVYNDVNVNFVTGIDFNYKIIERLSFTFTPTSRWYFKPVLTMNGQPTDELTLGFRTGVKFEF